MIASLIGTPFGVLFVIGSQVVFTVLIVQSLPCLVNVQSSFFSNLYVTLSLCCTGLSRLFSCACFIFKSTAALALGGRSCLTSAIISPLLP